MPAVLAEPVTGSPSPIRRLLLGVLLLALVYGVPHAADAAPGSSAAAGTAITAGDYERGPDGQRLSRRRAVALVQASVRAAQEDREVPERLRPAVARLGGDVADVGACNYSLHPAGWKLCRRGDRRADRTVVVLGHSHGRAWIPAFERFTKRAGYAAYYLVKPQCSPVRLLTAKKNGQVRRGCARFNRWTERQIARLDPDLVTISGTAPTHVVINGRSTSRRPRILRAMRGAFGRLIEDVSPHADRVGVIGAPPRRVTEPGACLGAPDASLGDCLDRPQRYALRVAQQSRIAARRHGAGFVDSARWFCAADRCPAVIGSYVAMRDTLHQTTAYAASLAGPLGRALGLLRRKRSAGR